MAVSNRLDSIAHELFDALDRKDFERISSAATDDVQGVDELSGGWMRGRPAMEAYFASLGDQVSNVRSTLSDVNTIEVGDVGIVTLVLDQEGMTREVSTSPSMLRHPSSPDGSMASGAWPCSIPCRSPRRASQPIYDRTRGSR